MVYVVVSLVALFAAFLALFSGFGLGTLLTPAFVFFFPVPVAVAATAIVHLLNNIFRAILTGKNANWSIVARFGIPAVLAAIGGASLLGWLSSTGMPVISQYWIGKTSHDITVVKMVLGITIIAFAMFDLLPRFQKLSFDRKWLPLGGIFSGFFGGLTGNQGALRSAFLVKAGLEPKEYVSTNAICVVMVDIVRLAVYGITFYTTSFVAITDDIYLPVIVATIVAFLGTYLAFRYISRVTIRTIQIIVGIMLVFVGIGLAIGLI
jgi:uncharacterized protein